MQKKFFAYCLLVASAPSLATGPEGPPGTLGPPGCASPVCVVQEYAVLRWPLGLELWAGRSRWSCR